jgi:hypothetical protein
MKNKFIFWQLLFVLLLLAAIMVYDICSGLYFFGFFVGLFILFLLWVLFCLRPQLQVKTPLEIAYRDDDGNFSYLPYLDIVRRSEVFGICLGDYVWKTSDEEDGDYLRICDLSETYVSKRSKGISAPDEKVEPYAVAYMYMKLFGKTVDILNENGVSADRFKRGGYWICGSSQDGYAKAYDFVTGTFAKQPMSDVKHIRILLRRND